MPARPSNVFLSLTGVFLVALSLSIGWGIRGNYGHETGAMFPGALAAMAVCLVSGRKDWHDRVAYFAFFGMLGWAFGGSISYMQVIGYTHSGHAPSQLYGFAGLFLIGFLWAGLGGMGTAIPAVLDRKQLYELFMPTALLLEIWVGLAFVMQPLMALVQATLELRGIDSPMQRQEQGLYWLDSDWLQVFIVTGGILLYDLLDRRFAKAYWLPLLAGAGALAGYGVHALLASSGATGWMETHLIQPQGELSVYSADNLAVTNWPLIVLHYRAHLGWIIGLLCGISAYFACFGQFRNGSALYLHMAVGWIVGFLALPVVGSLFLGAYGGLRLTPPRGDNWAGVLGTFVGAMIYLLRNHLKAIALAAIVCGTIGGIGFSGTAWLKMMMLVPGNQNLSNDPAVREAWTRWQDSTDPSYADVVKDIPVDEAWQHYQHSNWHSFLEQTYGFVNGIGVAVAIGLLAWRLGPLNENAPKQCWTIVLAVTFALPVLTYVNMVKNVADWAPTDNGPRLLPAVMKAPWFQHFELSALGWFNLFFALASLAMIALMVVQTSRPLAIVPESWLGRGQLLYFLLLWAFVLGNFAKALSGFSDQRLLTEGGILFNAIVATVLVLILPRQTEHTLARPEVDFSRWLRVSVVALLLAAVVIPAAETYSIRRVYGDALAQPISPEHFNFRFGPRANWKVKPLLKGEKHR